MKLSKFVLAGAILALASPVAALAQNASAETAALNAISSDHRAQVQNVLALLETNQIDAGTAAIQIDSILSDSEQQALLDQAAKQHVSDQNDAGVYLSDLVKPPSK